MSMGNRGNGAKALTKQGEAAIGGDQVTDGNSRGVKQQTDAAPVPIAQYSGPNGPVASEAQTQQQLADPYGRRDIIAQETMADASIAMAIAAFLTLVVTTVGTILIWKQISLTREAVTSTNDATKAMEVSNEIAERLGEAQVRCYIWGVECRIGFTEETAVINLDIKNSGQSPALGVTASAILTVHNGNQIWIFDQSSAGSVMSSSDIAAGEVKMLPAFIAADISCIVEGPPADSGIRFAVTVRSKLNGRDVFGKSVSEECEFIAFIRAGLRESAWITAVPARQLIETEQSTIDDTRPA